jgi:hypothetical protein
MQLFALLFFNFDGVETLWVCKHKQVRHAYKVLIGGGLEKNLRGRPRNKWQD